MCIINTTILISRSGSFAGPSIPVVGGGNAGLAQASTPTANNKHLRHHVSLKFGKFGSPDVAAAKADFSKGGKNEADDALVNHLKALFAAADHGNGG